jgi:hypothetical protein
MMGQRGFDFHNDGYTPGRRQGGRRATSSARAYTVGHNIVFGTGRFARGRRGGICWLMS